ncbi:MAG: FAS1-like dehydratase domain-containing protein [Burkholderiales bacterium]
MALLTEALKKYIGLQSQTETACDPVERGAVRRYAQAIQDEDPIFSETCANNARFGGPVAPPLFPTHMFRRAFGVPDPMQLRARDPDFDGLGATSAQGLPELEPIKHLALLNGGSEIEFFRYARLGETVKLRSRYADIVEKETSKGPMLFVTIETEYRNGDDELLMTTRRTLIRR